MIKGLGLGQTVAVRYFFTNWLFMVPHATVSHVLLSRIHRSTCWDCVLNIDAPTHRFKFVVVDVLSASETVFSLSLISKD